MRRKITTGIFVSTVALLAGMASSAAAQRNLEELADNPPLFLATARKLAKWDEAAEPAKIVGPIYFVGTKGLSAPSVTFTTLPLRESAEIKQVSARRSVVMGCARVTAQVPRCS